MKHLGDITKIDGHKVPLVNIVTGGSPCQDLSAAGRRQGLSGERSGLFMEQIRIIKEMRDESTKQLRSSGTTFDIRRIQPRFMVWENVPGAFSSNGGEDFRAVLEETAKIADEDATIPRLAEKQKWTPAGCILGDGWSIAWRVHDAQFWGVPQRRKRIALVADFGGDTAPEILFERESVSRNFEQSGETRKGSPTTAEGSPVEAISFLERAGCDGGVGKVSKSLTSRATDSDHIPCVIKQEDPKAYGFDPGTCRDVGELFLEEVSKTVVNGTCPGYHNAVLYEPKCIGNGQAAQTKLQDTVGTLNCMHDQQAVITYGIDRAAYNQGKNALYDFSVEEEIAQTIIAKGPGEGTCETVGALCARDYKGVGSQYVDEGKCIIQCIPGYNPEI